jgi:hypothetical protein
MNLWPDVKQGQHVVTATLHFEGSAARTEVGMTGFVPASIRRVLVLALGHRALLHCSYGILPITLDAAPNAT